MRDFTGINNRFGQVATSDFIEHLCTKSPMLLQELKISFSATLQCISCKWVSHQEVSDVSLKLYIPPDKKCVSLADLVAHNSRGFLDRRDAVYCGKCLLNTPHSMTHDYDPDVLLIEIIRVTDAGSRWIKNGSPITFPTVGVNLPNFSRFYRVVGTCHHSGSLSGGHWLTKACTARGWYELDDLKPENTPTNPPGDNDDSVVLILLVVDNKMV